ncbi:MAG: N-acetyltransferase [Clostridia bacterium]|nr:N-acetyltransferase [Clostridia bacterium]
MIDTIKVKKNLYLRRISHHDAHEVFDLIDNNRQHLSKWLPFVESTTSVESTHSFIDQVQKHYSRELVFTICFGDEICGLIGLKDIDTQNRKVEIGYWIGRQWQGKGIVTESANALVDTIFSQMNINRVQIKCAVGNSRSSNIPKRLGFKREGIERQGERHKNGYFDLEVYALLKTDWLKQ